MRELTSKQVKVEGGFWGVRLAMNAEKAIFHQWEQLEKSGCIENFRLVADRKEGIREGYFFADSDAYKWLDAAARVYAARPSNRVAALMDEFIALIGCTQTDDGYIYTYNQLFFPQVRWANIQIEHELYCHGHLIEAAVSHFEATGTRSMLAIAEKAAGLLVQDFAELGPAQTPGHQEIEIALLRLYQVTEKEAYLDLAEAFLEQRGRFKFFGAQILRENSWYERRNKDVAARQQQYYQQHPEHAETFKVPGDQAVKTHWTGKLRWLAATFTGRYFQQDKPIRAQNVPVGHAVRFTYLETGIAMLHRLRGDESLVAPLKQAWERMVSKRMYVTGGIGARPDIEGFGRDYELDPEYSYSETCAALGSIFWNWEMSLLTGESQYADLLEWQLYNAASVGLGQDGASYLYNNPLTTREPYTRYAWFRCACCPSNISRVWADLGKYLYSFDAQQIWMHQYISSSAVLPAQTPVQIEMQSQLPWHGQVQITVTPETPAAFTLNLRLPSWADGVEIKINGAPVDVSAPRRQPAQVTASGYDPRTSAYLPIRRTWQPGDVVEIDFAFGIRTLYTHPKVKATRGQAAVSRGPLVYCLESVDHPGLDIFDVHLDTDTLTAVEQPEQFGGIVSIAAKDLGGGALTLIPYYLWANRAESTMTVYMRAAD